MLAVPAAVATEYPKHDPDVIPATPHGPGEDWPASWELMIGVGHAGPYFPYDPEDPRAPAKEKRSPGFVTADDYVRGGKVHEYKHKRKR